MRKKKTDASYIMGLSDDYGRSAILHTALNLDIFSKLSSKPSDVDELAGKIKASSRGTAILLHALAGMGLIKKKGERFFNSPDSEEFLVKGKKRYYGHMVEFDAMQWPYWGILEESVISGSAAKIPDMFQADPEQVRKFIMGMHSIAMARGDAVHLAKKIKLKGYKKLIDIGGGPGTFAIQFCIANPDLNAAVFDLPATLKITSEVIEQFRMKKRIKMIPGDYNNDKIPEGYDAAFLSNIIHAENEKDNFALMKKIYSSLNPGGMIMIKDHILDKTGTIPSDGAVFAVTMLLFTKGNCYKFIEVKDWLRQAGFKKISLIEPGPPMWSQLVTAVK